MIIPKPLLEHMTEINMLAIWIRMSVPNSFVIKDIPSSILVNNKIIRDHQHTNIDAN